MQTYDVIIVGGGMAGLALACALRESHLQIAVVEQTPAQQVNNQQTMPALRVSAINAASERFLERLEVWPAIVSLRSRCYHGIDVWERDSFGRITFDGAQHGLSHLGYIIENNVIHSALWQQAARCGNIDLIAPAQPQQVAFGDNDAFITLKDGRMISARLLVAADGAQSWLRKQADIPLTFRDYDHHALVATVRTALPHQAVARQVFYKDGILAFLPLEDAHLCSIVWSLPPRDAMRLRSASPTLFNRELAATFDLRAGLCELVSERQTFPLTARYARKFAAHRLALLGDAAHTIHPLAGQGINLGFMDAAALAGEIKRLHQQGRDIGQYLYLRRYERCRKLSAARMLAGMQGFHSLFAGASPAKKLLRDMGLKLADTVPGIKSQLLMQATGWHDLPDWLK